MQSAPIVMPKLGLTMSEGLIVEWHVKPGDEVAAGQILFVVETDKISNEIEAPAPGKILKLLVPEGDTVPVGASVALWTGPAQGNAGANDDDHRNDTPDAPDAQADAVQADIPPAVIPAAAAGERPRATPFARRLAAMGGIDIATVAGTGPRGRIQGRDVQSKLDEAAQNLSPAAAPPPANSPPPPAAALNPSTGRPERDLRPLIAARVSRAKAEIPHFYVTADAEFDALIQLRTDLNSDPEAPRKLSITALLAMAVAGALSRAPGVNCVWNDGRSTPLDGIAIGIAVDTPGGVMAPVVAVTAGVYGLAEAMESAIERARQGRLSAADTGAAAIGISNVGMFGVRALTPIIDPDQSFMLGVGAPHVAFRLGKDGMPKPVQQVTLTLACDHRLIDGAAAARFLASIVSLIEHPSRLLAR